MNRYERRKPPFPAALCGVCLIFMTAPPILANTITAVPSPATVNVQVQLTANIDQSLVEVWDASGNRVPPTSYTYSWDFGDGTTATTSTSSTSHTYSSSGTYTVACSLSGSAGTQGETNNTVSATSLQLTVNNAGTLTISAPSHVSTDESIAISASGVASNVTITVTPAAGYTLLSGNLTGPGSVAATVKYDNAGTYSINASAPGYAAASTSVGVHSYTISGTFAPYGGTNPVTISSQSNEVSTTFALSIADSSVILFGADATGASSTNVTLSAGSGNTTIYANQVGSTTITSTPQ